MVGKWRRLGKEFLKFGFDNSRFENQINRFISRLTLKFSLLTEKPTVSIRELSILLDF